MTLASLISGGQYPHDQARNAVVMGLGEMAAFMRKQKRRQLTQIPIHHLVTCVLGTVFNYTDKFSKCHLTDIIKVAIYCDSPEVIIIC